MRYRFGAQVLCALASLVLCADVSAQTPPKTVSSIGAVRAAEPPDKLTDALSAEYSLERLVLRPDLEGENTWIHVLRANQFFSKDLFARLLVQTNSAIERNNVQAVFVWCYRPPYSAWQVAYHRGTAAFGERSAQGHTLFVKMSAVF